MSVEFENFGFYRVNINYVKYLHSKDSQVFYEDDPNYIRKPYLGLIIKLGNYKYCIPLTSAKVRQLNWANASEHNYVIYEFVKFAEIHSNDVYKRLGNTDNYKKLLAVLEIRKMIPVDDNLCEYIDFTKETDKSYKDLLEKEYNFIKPLKDNILLKAEELYNKQISTDIIKLCYCSFKILEQAYIDYSKEIEEQAAIVEDKSDNN